MADLLLQVAFHNVKCLLSGSRHSPTMVDLEATLLSKAYRIRQNHETYQQPAQEASTQTCNGLPREQHQSFRLKIRGCWQP